MVINNYFSSDGRIFAHFRHRINSILGFLYSVGSDGFLFLILAVSILKYNGKEKIVFFYYYFKRVVSLNFSLI